MQDYKQEIAANWSLINRIAERRFADSNRAEEAALFVLDQLEADNCRRLRAFSGRAKLSTYIGSLTIRLLEDFSRKRFGRVRPPAWITALGGIWITLFQFLCLQRLSVVEAVETMKSRVAESRYEQLEETAWTILEKVTNCGQYQGLEVSLDNTEEGRGDTRQNLSSRQNNPEEHVLVHEREILFELLFQNLVTSEKDQSSVEQFFKDIQDESIQLSAEERLLLKLCFQDELSVTRAGKMLGMNANQAHGKLRRLLARLRDAFDSAGIGGELRELLHG